MPEVVPVSLRVQGILLCRLVSHTVRAGVKPEERSEKVQRFERDVLFHCRGLYRATLRLTGRPTDAEDLVQETCLRAFRSLDQLRHPAAVKVWLFTFLCAKAMTENKLYVTCALSVNVPSPIRLEEYGHRPISKHSVGCQATTRLSSIFSRGESLMALTWKPLIIGSKDWLWCSMG